MKKLVRNSEIHLRDILGVIQYIEFCEDVRRSPRMIAASEDVDDDFMQMIEDDKLTLTLPDDQLLKLSDERIESIADGELLHRLNRLCPDRLSDEQIKLLRDYYTNSHVDIDEEDIVDFLDKIKSCTHVIYNHKHKKTKEFILDSGKHIRDEDCLAIIKSLTVEDYREGMYAADTDYFGDTLIVFRPYTEWVTNDGQVLTDICIYMKLDIDLTNETSVVLVSFHEAKYED